jgi:hypothetical protein
MQRFSTAMVGWASVTGGLLPQCKSTPILYMDLRHSPTSKRTIGKIWPLDQLFAISEVETDMPF